MSNHGAMPTATKNENSMAADAFAGIGAMYGPMRPDTNIIGSSAAITVRVAITVGLPTSDTALIAASTFVRPSFIAQ